MGAEMSTETQIESPTADTGTTVDSIPLTVTAKPLLMETKMEVLEAKRDPSVVLPRQSVDEEPSDDDTSINTQDVATGAAPVGGSEQLQIQDFSSLKDVPLVKHPLSWRVSGWLSGRSESDVSTASSRFTRRETVGMDPKQVFEGLEGVSLMVALNQVGQLKSLIAKKADLNKRDVDDDRVPLHWAAARGRIRCLRLLLMAGADTSVLDSHGNTPARLAQQCEESIAYSMLMNGPSQPDPKSSTAMAHLPQLSQYAALNQAKKLQACLRRGAETADPNQQDPDGDRYPLHWAAARGFLKSVEVLLKAGAEIGAIDSHGQTAAGLAFSLNQHEVHQRLMNALTERTMQRAVGFSEPATHAHPTEHNIVQHM